jgi:hypothetical protein
MEEEVGASGGFPLPATLELMARGLLEAGKRPTRTLDPGPDGLDQGLEGQQATPAGRFPRPVHEASPWKDDAALSNPYSSRFALLRKAK